MSEVDYDLIFLGGGLNYAGAVVASKAGLKTALIEREMAHLGGTCLHNGCIPSKMYLAAAETLMRSRKPFIEGDLKLKMAELRRQKEQLLAHATAVITRQCSGVELLATKGRLIAPHRVETAEGKSLTARYVILGTGSRPFVPEGIVTDAKRVITSDEVFAMEELPEKIAIYGDGAIGLEMASLFAAAGVETELIWRRDTLLHRAHPMIAASALEQMKALGVTLLPDRSIESAHTTKERGVHIRYTDGTEHYVPILLVATGRRPVTDAVACSQIAIEHGAIVTDEHFETTLADHYAIGDCNGKLQLAHAARAQVLYVIDRILSKKPEPLDLSRVVRFIHALPCGYATVGQSKAQLEEAQITYRESVVPLRGLPFAVTHEGELGVMVLYTDREGFLLGGEIFAPNAEELIAIVAMSLAAEADARTAQRTILAHPTFSESLERAYRRFL